MKIYRLFLFTFFSFSFIICNGQTKLSGKTYVAEVGATCKYGVGMIWTYQILEFKKDSVTVSYRVNASVASDRKEMYEHMYDHLKKTYKWKRSKNKLIIENYPEISKLTVQKSKIIGRDNIRMENMIFTEEVEQKAN
jgi:hypothetical protein